MQSDSVTRAGQEQRWVVDAIEAGYASVEVDGTTLITVPMWLLPPDAQAGHVLRVRHQESGGSSRAMVAIEIDHAATEQALARSAAQVKKGVRQANDPGGDLHF